MKKLSRARESRELGVSFECQCSQALVVPLVRRARGGAAVRVRTRAVPRREPDADERWDLQLHVAIPERGARQRDASADAHLKPSAAAATTTLWPQWRNKTPPPPPRVDDSHLRKLAAQRSRMVEEKLAKMRAQR